MASGSTVLELARPRADDGQWMRENYWAARHANAAETGMSSLGAGAEGLQHHGDTEVWHWSYDNNTQYRPNSRTSRQALESVAQWWVSPFGDANNQLLVSGNAPGAPRPIARADGPRYLNSASTIAPCSLGKSSGDERCRLGTVPADFIQMPQRVPMSAHFREEGWS